jgi:thymidine kinase
MEGDVITLQDLFLFDYGMGVDPTGRYRGQLKSTGIRPRFSEKLADVGITLKAELFESNRVHEVDVIGLDEVQFFDNGITHLAMQLVHLGKRVILAGLDTTFANEPFGPVPNLMALADEVTKLSAVCMTCGAPAIHTQRLGQSQELVVVGAAGLYEARCRTHFEPFTDEHHSEQLDLPAIVSA